MYQVICFEFFPEFEFFYIQTNEFLLQAPVIKSNIMCVPGPHEVRVYL